MAKQSYFRVQVKTEFEIYADNQKQAHEKCLFLLAAINDIVQHESEDNPFLNTKPATAFATVQG